MAWFLFLGILIIIGYIIYNRKKVSSHLSAQEIKELVARKMKQIDEIIVSLSIEGKTVSLPPLLAHLEESKREHLGDEAYIAAMDNLKIEIIKKYGASIPPDEAFIEDGEMIIWSEFPGCYERHLQRRYKSFLFPQERRSVSRKEIGEARERDNFDRAIFIEEIIDVTNQLEVQPKLSSQEAISVSRKVQNLIEQAAALGGNFQKEIGALEAVEKHIGERLNEVMPQGAALGKKISDLSAVNRIPFMAQLTRENSPILKDEKVPTLLSEDLSTVSFVGFVSRSFPGFKPSETDIKRHLDEAIREGFDQARAEQIMNAWNERQ